MEEASGEPPAGRPEGPARGAQPLGEAQHLWRLAVVSGAHRGDGGLPRPEVCGQRTAQLPGEHWRGRGGHAPLNAAQALCDGQAQGGRHRERHEGVFLRHLPGARPRSAGGDAPIGARGLDVHEVAHDGAADVDALARETQVVAVDAQQLAVDVTAGVAQEERTVALVEHVEVDALACAQGGGDEVVVMGVGVDALLLVGERAALDGFDILHDVGRVPMACEPVVAMGRGPQADVRHVVPIAAVVAAAVWARPLVAVGQEGEIADLVMLVARRRELVDELVVHVEAQLLVGLLYGALLPQAVEWGALFNHQSVGREVLGPERQGATYVGQPIGERLVGEAKHEVDADVAYAVEAKGLHGAAHLTGRVATVEEAQAVVVEGLGAHAHAVHRQVVEHVAPYVVGVALHGDLRMGIHGEHLIYISEDLVEIGRRQLRGRATPQVDGGEGDGIVGHAIAQQEHLAAERIDIAVVQLGAYGGIEAAIDATARTERNVNVKSGFHIVMQKGPVEPISEQNY